MIRNSVISDFDVSTTNSTIDFLSTTKGKNRSFYIKWYKHPPWLPNKFDFKTCEFFNCKLGEKVNHAPSDVIIFHHRHLKTIFPRKSKGQIWVLWDTESPANDKPLSTALEGLLDWTITYRTDSEIVNQRMIIRNNYTIQKNYTDIFRGKTKFAAWAVSNCNTQSKREEYVKMLQSYIDIDIFGECSKKKNICENMSSTKCQLLLSRDYKFYLGFENSICKDYVTEKLQLSFLIGNNMINVYRGAPNVDSLVPSGTFINTKQYGTPKALAGYLKRLASNESEYTSYLKENDKFMLFDQKTERAFCDLCKLLNSGSDSVSRNTGKHFNKWFREGACSQPSDLEV